MTEEERAKVTHLENQILRLLPNLSHALHATHRTISIGFSDSEMNGAILDLRNAANRLEEIRKEWPQ